MATLTDELAGEYRTLKQGCGLIDRSERGKLALTGAERKAFLAGQVTNDIEGLQAGDGCYAAFLTHKGKMLGDLRVLAVEDDGAEPELLLDTERATLQALFDLVRRFKIGYDVELHKRTVQRGLLSLVGPGARAVAGAEDLAPEEHAHRAGEIAGHAVRLIVTDVGIDVLCEADDTDAVRAALLAAGATAVSEQAAEILRVERGRPRYGVDARRRDDPPGGRAQRARRELHEGLLRRPGDGRAPLLPRQAQPPSARPAALRAGRGGRRAAARRARRRHARELARLARAGADRAGARAARGVPGDTVAVAGGASAEVVELPFSSA